MIIIFFYIFAHLFSFSRHNIDKEVRHVYIYI